MLPNKLQKAVNTLLFAHPFFAAMLLKQRIVEDANEKTFYVDGEKLGYNPQFLETLSHEETVGVLAHEILHLTSFHHCRMKGRDGARWNKACDYAINPILTASGFKLPKGALINSAYAGKSAEEIYRILPPEPKDNKGGQNNDNGFGEIKQSAQSEEIAEERAKIQTEQAKSRAKAAGQMPEALNRAINDVPPRMDWREILPRFISENAPVDQSWMKPNRRFISQNLILPSLAGKTYGEVIFVADTSGSISVQEVAEVASEMLAALAQIEQDGKTPEITAIYCDSQIQNVEILTPFAKPNPKGGGGTDFKPPFDYVQKEGLEPRGMVYFTDGQCNSFPSAPAYPVLWIVTGNYHFAPPFGEVVYASQVIN